MYIAWKEAVGDARGRGNVQNAISSRFSRPSSACIAMIGECAQRAEHTTGSANASHTRAAVPHQVNTHYHNTG